MRAKLGQIGPRDREVMSSYAGLFDKLDGCTLRGSDAPKFFTSLRTQGPIRRGHSFSARCSMASRITPRPVVMGPCVRRDDDRGLLNRLPCRRPQFRNLGLAEIRGRFSRQRRQHQRHHVGEALVPRVLFQEVAAEDHAQSVALLER